MNNNIKFAKQLVRIARSLVAGQYEDQSETFEIAVIHGDKYILHHKEGNLWRIQSCKDFGDVKKGDFGGLVENEYNLSQEGFCWIYDNAIVAGTAKVCENAKVYGNALLYDHALIYSDAKVYDGAIVCDSAHVSGKAEVHGKNVEIYGKANVYGRAEVHGNNIHVYGEAQVGGDAQVCSMTQIYGKSIVRGNAVLFDTTVNDEIVE